MKRMLGIAASCSFSLTHSQLGSVDTEGKMILFPTLVGRASCCYDTVRLIMNSVRPLVCVWLQV